MWEFLKIILTGSVPALVLGWYLGRIALVHSQRSKVITELYAKIDQTVVALQEATSFWLADHERSSHFEALESRCNDLRTLMQENRIWFSVDVCQKWDNLWDKLKIAITALKNATDPTQNTQRPALLSQADAIIKNELNPLREEIESDFRRLIGVNLVPLWVSAGWSACSKIWRR